MSEYRLTTMSPRCKSCELRTGARREEGIG